MSARIRSLFHHLAQARAELAALSGDLGLAINHPSGQALAEGVTLQGEILAQVAVLDGLSQAVAALLRRANHPLAGGEGDARARPPGAWPAGAPCAHEAADPPLGQGLDEASFVYRPCGFQLGEEPRREVSNWPHLFQQICRALWARDPVRFAGLPADPALVNALGQPLFSPEPSRFQRPLALPGALYTEASLPPRTVARRLKTLLDRYGLRHTLQIF